MQHKIPIIASDIPAQILIFRTEKMAFFSSWNVEVLSQLLTELFSIPHYVKKSVMPDMHLFEKHFQINKNIMFVLKKYIQIFFYEKKIFQESVWSFFLKRNWYFPFFFLIALFLHIF